MYPNIEGNIIFSSEGRNPYLWDIVLESCKKKKNQNEVHTANIEKYHEFELQFEWFFDNSKSGR